MNLSSEPQELTRETIWMFKQNKPSLVIRDVCSLPVEKIVPREIENILLKRGVNKWLTNRREFIKLKNRMKLDITRTLAAMQTAKQEKRWHHRQYLRGQLSILVCIREDLRTICKSERWVNPF